MNGGKTGYPRNRDVSPARAAAIDDVLDRAVAAINRGDRAAAAALAGRVLEVDSGNAEAEDLLTAPGSVGEIRRLTILFTDLVDSTALSNRVEPETYRMLVGRYREQVLSVVNRFEGHVGSTQGDGLLVVFGHPIAHENDVRRAVLAGLEITRNVSRLSEQAQRQFGEPIDVRVGVHRGLVYLDTAQDDVYGLAANLAARVSGLAPPGSVVVSDAVEPLVRKAFELEARPAASVKGMDRLIGHHRVIGEQTQPDKTSRSPLVGRERELARVQKSWAHAQAGTLTIPGVVFRGEPGIGKSRLAASAVEMVEHSGAVVLELNGSPFHTDAGLHPVRTLLERRCSIGRLTDPAERLLLLDAEVRAIGLDPVTAVPLLAPVLGIDAEHGYEPVAAEGRKLYELIAQAIHDYVLACVGDGAALLVAEDVHWFDSSTTEVLGALLAARSPRLMVVITGRPGSWLPGDWPVDVLDLAPLTDEQSDELITALDPRVTPEDRAAVTRRCDGIPFYIEQVVDGVSETGVPEALYEPLFARLRSSTNVVPVVEAAAVIGRHVDRRLLGSVIDMTDDEIDTVIDRLEDARVLEPWGTDGWCFRHELLREVASELAPPSVRRELHARVADSLLGGARGGDPDWRMVAAHYEQAERFAEAASAFHQAAEDARGRGGLAEARTYLTLGVAGLQRCAPSQVRDRHECALRLQRGFVTAAVEGNSSRTAATDFQRCLQLGGTDLRDDELFATMSALFGYYVVRADLRRAVQVIDVLRAGLDQGRQWFRPALEVLLGTVAWLHGEFDAAAAHLQLATANRAPADHHKIDAVWFLPDDSIGGAHVHLALTCLVRGDLAGAAAQLAHTARRADQLGFPQGPYMHAYAHFVDSWLHIATGQLDRAAVRAADVAELAERHGFDTWQAWAAIQQATIGALAALAALGGRDPDPARLSKHVDTLAAFLDTWRANEINIYRSLYEAALGQLLLAAGQPDSARAGLDAALHLAHETGMHFGDAELLRLRAHTHTDPAARYADIDTARELARRQGATLFELRAALDDFELRGQPARAALIEVASRIPAGGTLPELARVQASDS